MKKEILNIIRKDILWIAAGAVVGITALLLVHLLPVEPMQEHVYWSLGMIEKEFSDEVVVEGYRATLTGNFTDCLMLEHAVYKSDKHSILEQVLHMYRSESCEADDEWQPGRSLKDYLGKVSQPREVEYGRYWHGYLVVLKPLLLLTSFNTIRLLNSAIQILLTGFVVIGLCRRDAAPLATGFLCSLPFLFFVSTYASLSLSICFYVMECSLLVQTKWDSRLYEKRRYDEFFLVVGMATAYFDFLTYPIITLVFPLCVYLYFHEDTERGAICRMGRYSFQWFGGYTGLWAMKWVLTDLLVGGVTIRDAADTLMTRTDSAAGYSRISGFISVLWKNMQPYGNWCFVILAGLAAMLLAARGIKCGIRKNLFRKAIPYVLLALYPFLWFFIAQNHSEQHWQYTCRIFACSIFAAYAGCLKMQKKSK